MRDFFPLISIVFLLSFSKYKYRVNYSATFKLRKIGTDSGYIAVPALDTPSAPAPSRSSIAKTALWVIAYDWASKKGQVTCASYESAELRCVYSASSPECAGREVEAGAR